MSLQMRKTSGNWYGQFNINGERRIVPLGVKIRGERPDSINGTGDSNFEESRRQAQKAHDEILEKMEGDRLAEEAVRSLVKLKTGSDIDFPKIAELADRWEELPRKKSLSDRYIDQCRSQIEGFSKWMNSKHREVSEFVGVNYNMALEYMREQEERGITSKRYNDILKLLKSAYSKLHPDIDASRNPFGKIPGKYTETVGRRPFSPEQLSRILKAVEKDELMRPLVVTGICTAMRLGDCAQLEWKDVDLQEGFIKVKTSKTGGVAEIPIVSALMSELASAGKSAGYVFPKLARMYRSGPSKLSYRFRKVLVAAEVLVPSKDSKNGETKDLKKLSEKMLRSKVEGMLGNYTPPPNSPEKPENMRKVFDMYIDGKNMPEIAKKLGLSRGCVSNYLNEMEDGTGTEIITRRGPGVRNVEAPGESAPKQRERKPSIYGFHSLRSTWVTIMLNAGLPLELVKRVTGHKTVEVVLSHYFKPDRDNLRQQILKLTPNLLPDKQQIQASSKTVEQLLDEATEENAWETVQTLRSMLGQEAAPNTPDS